MTQTDPTKDSQNSPNLYIIGFMGTGKSRISRRVAKKLNLQFFDVDDEIEKENSLKLKFQLTNQIKELCTHPYVYV